MAAAALGSRTRRTSRPTTVRSFNPTRAGLPGRAEKKKEVVATRRVAARDRDADSSQQGGASVQTEMDFRSELDERLMAQVAAIPAPTRAYSDRVTKQANTRRATTMLIPRPIPVPVPIPPLPIQ